METSPIVKEFVSLFATKEDFNSAFFEMTSFIKEIDYGVMTEGAKREVEIRKKIDSVKNETLKTFFKKLIREKKYSFFEPGNYKSNMAMIEEAAKNVIVIGLIIAVKMELNDLAKLLKKLPKTNKKVMFDVTVDPSIIGGAIIKKDNYILDYSVKTKLTHLAADWKKSIRATKEE